MHATLSVTPPSSRIQDIASVDILAPAELFHPVLPVRSGNKLTFPLCAACVKQEQDNPMLERSDVCHHTPEERTLRGTWCTPEIEKAVEKGYRVIKIHEVWHFSQQRDGLFRDYVNTWLKLKQEAAGWPRWCDKEEKKQQYLTQYREREGIDLDYASIKKNPGRKATAKLMLNPSGENSEKGKTSPGPRPSLLLPCCLPFCFIPTKMFLLCGYVTRTC